MTDRVRTIHISWDAEVTRADPNWRRDAKRIPQLEPEGLPATRAAVTVDWANRHPYDQD